MEPSASCIIHGTPDDEGYSKANVSLKKLELLVNEDPPDTEPEQAVTR